MEGHMAMEIKPPVSQGPIVGPEDQTEIAATQDNSGGEQGGIDTSGNVEISSNTLMAMKQVGTETKGFLDTTEGFLRQMIGDQLEGKGIQNEDPSIGILGGPGTQA